MIKLELTDINVVIARLLLFQAGIKDCDCDTPCNCLVIEKMEMSVDETVIKTRYNSYRLKCIRNG